MPALGGLLEATAAAVDAYVACEASGCAPIQQRRLAEALGGADESLRHILCEWRGDEATHWLTFGGVLALGQRILTEVGHPVCATDSEARLGQPSDEGSPDKSIYTIGRWRHHEATAGDSHLTDVS
jgi:hypothetical protein